MNESKTYTANDIERYHRGEMTAAERHLLEKAALDDPMLADALEGYSFTQTPAADLQALQNKLQQRINPAKEKKIFFLGNHWMKIAALFILVAGGGWLVIQMLSNKSENVATVSANKQYKAPINNNTVATDSTAVTMQSSPVNSTSDSSLMVGKTSVVKNNSTRHTKPLSNNVTSTSPALNDTTNLTASNNENVTISRQIAPIASPENRTFNASKAKEERADNNVTAMKDANKTLSGRVSGDTIRDLKIVMKKLDGPPVEEVVLNKAKAKPRARETNVVIDSLEPAQGWSHFDDYIAENIKTPDELKDKPVKGEVELSFEVDKEGNPINITVTRSLCNKCDEEAIRLLKEGPKWKAKKKKGKVKIKFPLSP